MEFLEVTEVIIPDNWQRFNALLSVLAIGGMLGVFYLTPLRRSRLWTITVTPLASIIGSGFLVVAPLLYANFGRLYLPAIIGINVVAVGVGLVIRHNIKYFEPLLDDGKTNTVEEVLERLASLALGLSYMISVAFYVTLLSSFGLELFQLRSPFAIKLITTLILAFIGLVGYRKGLHGLEALEKVAVNAKLSIIAALLLVLVSSMVYFESNGGTSLVFGEARTGWEALKVLGGMLLIVQGFETVRYLGRDYTPQDRIKGMFLAQGLAAVIYFLFVWLAAPLSKGVTSTDETAIIQIVGRAAIGLAALLSVAAIFSQFGAAVADTVGTGGILEEETRGRLRRRLGYILVCGLAIALIWFFQVFAILTLASRAFALYYGLQAVIATLSSRHQVEPARRIIKLAVFSVLAVALFWITLFAIPAHA